MAALVTTANSAFHLLSTVDGKSLASYHNNAEFGTSPIFYDWINENGQVWFVRPDNSANSYVGAICNRLNVCLAVDKNTPKTGTRVIQWLQINEPGQHWELIKNADGNGFGPHPGIYVYIKNGFGLCLTRTNLQYATVTQETCNPKSNPNQNFFLAGTM